MKVYSLELSVYELFSFLDLEQVNWMLIRNLDFKKSIINKEDIDIIVHESTDYIRLKEKLIKKGYFCIEPLKKEFKDFFIYKYSEGFLIKFHFRKNLLYGVFKFKSNKHNLLFERKVKKENYFTASKEDEYIFLKLRYEFETKGRKNKYLDRIHELENQQLNLKYIKSQLEFDINNICLKEKIFFYFNISGFFKFIKNFFKRKYLNHKSSKLIVFNGIDGSGKTTITKLLNGQIPYNTKRIYLGRNLSESKIFFIKWIVDFVEKFSSKPIYGIVRLIRYPFSILDEVLRIIKIRYLLLKGTMILSDRYIYESVLEENKGLATKIKSLFLYFYPKPDLFVLLDVDPKIAYERKKENTIEQLEINRKNLLDFTKKEFSNNSLIITNKNIEKTKERVLLRICDLYR